MDYLSTVIASWLQTCTSLNTKYNLLLCINDLGSTISEFSMSCSDVWGNPKINNTQNTANSKILSNSNKTSIEQSMITMRKKIEYYSPDTHWIVIVKRHENTQKVTVQTRYREYLLILKCNRLHFAVRWLAFVC